MSWQSIWISGTVYAYIYANVYIYVYIYVNVYVCISYILEVSPRHTASLRWAADRADRGEDILEFHISALQGPVQGSKFKRRRRSGAQTVCVYVCVFVSVYVCMSVVCVDECVWVVF